MSQRHRTESAIRVLAYNQDQVHEISPNSIRQAKELEQQYEVVWIDIVGLGNLDLLRSFGELFGIHPLSLEDVLNVHQRAKFEKYESYNYFVTRMVSLLEDLKLQSEQLSLFHIGKFVVTFQQYEGDCLDPVRERIREGLGSIRKRSSDYLIYALIDMVLDHYFPILDQLGDRIDEIDSRLTQSNPKITPTEIHTIRSQLLDLGRWLRPNREMINQLLRDDVASMSAETQLFMRDSYDHVIQLYETVETYREICSDLRAYHLSVVGNRTNDVMKTLTIVSTIFIPLGFIAGLYGMNFEFIPELKWHYGYFAALALMVSIVTSLLFWFRQRGWFDD